MGQKLTDNQELELASMYESGDFSVQDICRKFDVARVTAHRIAARRGVRRPIGRQPKVFSRAQIDDMVSMARAGISQKKIADKYGVSQCKMSRIMAAEKVISSKGRSRRGEKHGAWKGGVVKANGGYLSEWVSDNDSMASMRNNQGYVLQHRLVMARHLGRPLAKTENVHHINGIRDDNRLENLELWTKPQPKGVRAHEAAHCATCSCNL